MGVYRSWVPETERKVKYLDSRYGEFEPWEKFLLAIRRSHKGCVRDGGENALGPRKEQNPSRQFVTSYSCVISRSAT